MAMFFLLLTGCAAFGELSALLEAPPVPPCDRRGAWWEDADGDGAGNPASVWITCTSPEGWVETAGDCDDADAAVVTGCDTGSGDTGSGDTGSEDTGSEDTGSEDTGDTGTGTAR